MKKVAIIAGGGPAGLTAALELLRRSDIAPIIFESDTQVGGISKTVNFRGNRIDLGGHRFFSKSEWVMKWWQEILPIETMQDHGNELLRINYQRQSHAVTRDLGPISNPDAVLLVRHRLSRILYRRRFFDYPLKLSADTLGKIGVIETVRIGLSYALAKMKLGRNENNLEEFLINRFGKRLYLTFFKNYTEKVWGVACREISAEWGAQRIKGLSITKAITHAIAKRIPFRAGEGESSHGTETSLIEKFLYPKFGPGQMWEEVARQIAKHNGKIHFRKRVVGIERQGKSVAAVLVRDESTGSVETVPCDFFISTMPVCELVPLLSPRDPRVAEVALQLPYRDFMTVGLLLRTMTSLGECNSVNGMPPDNWIYVQEPDVRVGRIQIFNNWSPALTADPSNIWLGLEYFCKEGDDLWSMSDEEVINFAICELQSLGLATRDHVLDGTVIRVPKAYPAYFGEYRDFHKVRDFLGEFVNLYPVGRNGMHRYNNQDHSMLSANAAVTSIINEGRGKSDIWTINAEDEYHEELSRFVKPPRGNILREA